MKLLAAVWFGSFAATLIVLVAMYRREPEPPPYVEDEDGVQPADPYRATYQGLFITGDYKWTAMQ